MDNNNNLQQQYYTFFYCTMHDDGAIVRGNHQYAEDVIKICGGCKCDTVDYSNKGIILYDGNDEFNYIAIKPVQYNYNRYGGGYEFQYYSTNIMDEEGKNIEGDERTKLENLISAMSNNHSHSHSHTTLCD
jgi:hypothetical protein